MLVGEGGGERDELNFVTSEALGLRRQRVELQEDEGRAARIFQDSDKLFYQ